MSVRLGAIAVLAGWSAAAFAIPAKLAGTLVVDPAVGDVAGDVCLRELGGGAGGFALNRGLNIRAVRAEPSGPLLEYEIDAKNPGDDDVSNYRLAVPAASQLCISYVGRFPVYAVDKGERSVADWKGSIAFDGRTIRAADQSRITPTPIVNGIEQGQLRYDIKVECASCRAIFWNGARPAAGPVAMFRSETARPVLLFAGDFEFASLPEADFVGPAVTAPVATALSAGLRDIAKAHETYLGLSYADQPSLMSFASTGQNRKIDAPSWQFVVWPTIAIDGRLTFDKYLRGGEPANGMGLSIQRFSAHEMAHYYFGTRFVATGPLKWFLTESTAEFMAMKAVRKLQGEPAYAELITGHAAAVAGGGTVTPLDRVTDPEEIGETYRYKLGPLLLIGMEQTFGAAVVQRLLTGLVADAPAGEIDFAQLRSRLLAAGGSEAQLAQFKARCLVATVTPACWSARST